MKWIQHQPSLTQITHKKTKRLITLPLWSIFCRERTQAHDWSHAQIPTHSHTHTVDLQWFVIYGPNKRANLYLELKPTHKFISILFDERTTTFRRTPLCLELFGDVFMPVANLLLNRSRPRLQLLYSGCERRTEKTASELVCLQWHPIHDTGVWKTWCVDCCSAAFVPISRSPYCVHREQCIHTNCVCIVTVMVRGERQGHVACEYICQIEQKRYIWWR